MTGTQCGTACDEKKRHYPSAVSKHRPLLCLYTAPGEHIMVFHVDVEVFEIAVERLGWGGGERGDRMTSPPL